MLILIFWLLLIAALFSYFIYPLILSLLPKTKYQNGRSSDLDDLPTISLIVTAHNEEKNIREKILNTLKIEYPAGKLEIIVASDGSTDKTNAIASEFNEILLVKPDKRLGKENAQREATLVAKGQIFVFSDISTQIPPEALLNLAGYFTNPDIGAVSSEDRFISSDGSIAGEGAYVKYEMWLRNLESQVAGLVGLSGSFFAARREVCTRWDIHSPSDFNTALNCAQHGLKAVTAPDVLGYYPDLKDSSQEYARKIRTVIRGMTALSRHPEVLNPFRFKLFSFQVFSHKLMRWLEPWFLALLLVVTTLLAREHAFFMLALIGQIIFYSVALLAHYKTSLQQQSVIKLIYFFVQVNLALFDASLRFLTGRRMTTWKPSAR